MEFFTDDDVQRWQFNIGVDIRSEMSASISGIASMTSPVTTSTVQVSPPLQVDRCGYGILFENDKAPD
jgi:hypothetical protein